MWRRCGAGQRDGAGLGREMVLVWRWCRSGQGDGAGLGRVGAGVEMVRGSAEGVQKKWTVTAFSSKVRETEEGDSVMGAGLRINECFKRIRFMHF